MDNQEFKPYKHDPSLGDYYQHPTFGIVNFARTQSSRGMPLFGSSILHSNTIRLEISHAELCRGLNSDRIFERQRIVEVEMSPTQFADAITSLNIGSGIPVTIRWIAPNNGEDLTRIDPPYQNKVEQFNTEFGQDIKQIAKSFDEVIELATETKAQKRLVDKIKILRQHIASNIPFVNRQFSEQMDKTVSEAKGEVEAFITHAVQAYGLEAIRKQAPQLPEATTINVEAKGLTEGVKDNAKD